MSARAVGLWIAAFFLPLAGCNGGGDGDAAKEAAPSDRYAPMGQDELKAFVAELRARQVAVPATPIVNAPKHVSRDKPDSGNEPSRLDMQKQLKDSPGNGELHARYAFATWNQVNDADEALRHARAALALGIPPLRQREMTLLFAAIAEFREDNDVAVRMYEKLLQLDPSNADADYRLGVLANGRGDTAAAERRFRGAIAAKHDHVQAHFALGQILLRRGKTDEARELLERHARLRELDQLGYLDAPEAAQCIALGNERALGGRLDAALAEFEHAMAIDPGNVDAASFRGATLLALGRGEEGVAALKEILAGAPRSPHALTTLADWYLASAPSAERSVELGLRFAQRGVAATQEKDPRALSLLARALARSGDRPGALAAVAKAKRLEPGSSMWTKLEQQIKDGSLDAAEPSRR